MCSLGQFTKTLSRKCQASQACGHYVCLDSTDILWNNYKLLGAMLPDIIIQKEYEFECQLNYFKIRIDSREF